jgi:ergothioneine biosynthesis protein EgtB
MPVPSLSLAPTRVVPRNGRSAQDALAEALFETRGHSQRLAAPLSAEDMTVQAMDDASPTKWHLAHVTWFFETFVLRDHLPGYVLFDPDFNYCFNSYYESQGKRHPRAHRGLLTRPSMDRVMAYRAHVDSGLAALFAGRTKLAPELAATIELGIHHEQQHQELLLTDILALFARNPLRPAYQTARVAAGQTEAPPLEWVEFAGGITKAGVSGEGFAWDNERPRHEVLLHPYRLASRLVSNGEWLAFMADGGYRTAAHWLADGWATVQREGWEAPLYWEQEEGEGDWQMMTLEGLVAIEHASPVAHVSYYEADAFARWAGKRLPTEFEWEAAAVASGVSIEGDREPQQVRPSCVAGGKNERLQQMFGQVWQWTQSAYLPYPGYRPPVGALGEYNGKFMVSQQVLRGSSVATPKRHARATYRNFFYPHHRWQFTGVRLADDQR